LTKIGNFKHEKETIQIAKTPGHRKNGRLSIRCSWLVDKLYCDKKIFDKNQKGISVAVYMALSILLFFYCDW